MSETKLQSFHLAVPVNDLEETGNFYVNVIGLPREEAMKVGYWQVTAD